MGKHLPSIMCSLRMPPGIKDAKGKLRTNGLVRTMSNSEIGIAISHTDGYDQLLILDRRTARLLAKRINRLLDITK